MRTWILFQAKDVQVHLLSDVRIEFSDLPFGRRSDFNAVRQGLDRFRIFCSPLIPAASTENVRERPAVAVRKGPLFDIRGSVLAEVRADGRRSTENVKLL